MSCCARRWTLLKLAILSPQPADYLLQQMQQRHLQFATHVSPRPNRWFALAQGTNVQPLQLCSAGAAMHSITAVLGASELTGSLGTARSVLRSTWMQVPVAQLAVVPVGLACQCPAVLLLVRCRSYSQCYRV